MTSLLAGTVAHGARGGRGVSTSHYRRRVSPGLPGILRNSPVTALTTVSAKIFTILFTISPKIHAPLIMIRFLSPEYSLHRKKEQC